MTSTASKPSSRFLLFRLTTALQAFQSHREDAPLNMLMLFLLIAERSGGVGAAELGRLAGVSAASVSRNVQAMGGGKEGQPGLGLVAKSIDPKNPRAHAIRLTTTGVALAREMAGAVQVGADSSASAVDRPAPQPRDTAHWLNWID